MKHLSAARVDQITRMVSLNHDLIPECVYIGNTQSSSKVQDVVHDHKSWLMTICSRVSATLGSFLWSSLIRPMINSTKVDMFGYQYCLRTRLQIEIQISNLFLQHLVKHCPSRGISESESRSPLYTSSISSTTWSTLSMRRGIVDSYDLSVLQTSPRTGSASTILEPKALTPALSHVFRSSSHVLSTV